MTDHEVNETEQVAGAGKGICGDQRFQVLLGIGKSFSEGMRHKDEETYCSLEKAAVEAVNTAICKPPLSQETVDALLFVIGEERGLPF